MSKARSIAKYTITSAVTGLYAGAIYKSFTDHEPKQVEPKRVAIMAAGLAGLTWAVTVL